MLSEMGGFVMTYEEALKYALEGETVFLIGSGFSVGAYNGSAEEDRSLWTGAKLAKKLAELTDMDEELSLDIVSQEYIDIYGEKQLVEYLKEHYVVQQYEEYYKALTKMKNIRVYTTNYDNLIEKVCRDSGYKITGLNINADVRKANKDRLVMHLNGYINDLDEDFLPDTFKLSHLSYDSMEFFRTPWYSYLIDELYSAKVIFIIGLSFKDDLDIRRIVANPDFKDKIFFVTHENISESNRRFFGKYGRVLLCGVKTFLEDLNVTKIEQNGSEKNNKIPYFKSFKKMEKYDNTKRVIDKDVYDLFFKGIESDGLYKKDENRLYLSLVNRGKIKEVTEGLGEGKSYIIHSDLGNGKTIFVNQIIDLCPNIDIYFMKSIVNNRVLAEIRQLCADPKEKIIICDPANLYLDVLRKFADFDLKNIRFIFVLRTSMYDNYYNSIYDLIDIMSNVNFGDPINLDELSHDEILNLDNIISKYGFYGEIAGFSTEKRLNYLKKNCEGRFQNILLYLFESMHIIDRFVESIGDLKANNELRQVLILSFISSILELGLTMNDFKVLLDIDDIERIIKRNRNCDELVDIEDGKILVKSSIIAKELMMKTDVFSKTEVFEVLVRVMRKLDQLYLGSEKYKNAMINLVSCSYISYVFGYALDSGKLIEYYENVKELKFCVKNLFFWEQYAIACVNLKQFDRAERYFKTAYSLAKARGNTFSAYQIDNHYARYLLENQLYYRKNESSLEVFVEAHRLLCKNSDIDRIRKNSRYYRFRVARLYKEYYDAFAIKYEEKDKLLFLARCKEMYNNLLSYKNMLNEDEIRKDVKECESGLKYILTNENVMD